MIKLKLVLATLLFATSLLIAEDDNRDRIVVLNLKPVNVAVTVVEAITENLITDIVNLDRYYVIERSQLNMILSELSLTMTDEFDESSAVEVGKLASAKIVILGSLSNIGGRFALNIRGIEVSTGKILFAKNIQKRTEADLFDATAEAVAGLGTGVVVRAEIASKNTPEEPAESTATVKTTSQLHGLNFAGIGLAVTGGVFALGGAGVLIYDIVGYMPQVALARNNGTSYADYETKFNTNIGLFAGGIAGIGLGVVLLGVSVPLILHKEKTQVSFGVSGDFIKSFGFNVALKF